MNIEPTTTFHTLYKRGTKGEVRCWRMELAVWEQDGEEFAAHRVVSNILDGTETASGWTITEPKNVGKKNATTRRSQAASEITNQYKIKSERGYFDDPDKIDEVPFTKPMLATEWEKRKAKVDFMQGVFAQPKLDGMRCIARADGLFTRTGKRIVSCPHVEATLAPCFEADPDLVLDGELYNHEYRDRFGSLMSVLRKAKPTPEDLEESEKVAQYHVYDIPSRGEEFRQRLNALPTVVAGCDPSIVKLVDTQWVVMAADLDELFARWLSEGYEGQMVRLNEPYQFKRSNFLMKRKDFFTDECAVLEIVEGVGNWAGYAKSAIIGIDRASSPGYEARWGFNHPEGTTSGTGLRGTQAALKELLTAKKPDWATVRYVTPTEDGLPRFPVIIDWGYGERED